MVSNAVTIEEKWQCGADLVGEALIKFLKWETKSSSLIVMEKILRLN
jgi:hypothetical protein